jgi:dihydroneopterin aldolase
MLVCEGQTISVRNLRIPTIIGVYDQERENEQEIICNLELKIRPNGISLSDKLCDTVDYATVANRLYDVIRTQNSHLLEHLAHLAIQEVFAIDPRISAVSLEIFKPGCIPHGDGAVVQMNYSKKEPLNDESTQSNRRTSC